MKNLQKKILQELMFLAVGLLAYRIGGIWICFASVFLLGLIQGVIYNMNNKDKEDGK